MSIVACALCVVSWIAPSSEASLAPPSALATTDEALSASDVAGSALPAWLADVPADELADAREDEASFILDELAFLRRDLAQPLRGPFFSPMRAIELEARVASLPLLVGCAPEELPRWDEIAAATCELLGVGPFGAGRDAWEDVRVSLLGVVGDVDAARELFVAGLTPPRPAWCGNAAISHERQVRRTDSVRAQRAGRLADALDDLEFAEPDGPRDHPSSTSIARRGLLRCALGRIDAAVPDLQRVVDLQPGTRWAASARLALAHAGRLVEPTLERLVARLGERKIFRADVVEAVGAQHVAGAFEWLVADAGDRLGTEHLRALGLLGDERARPLLARAVDEVYEPYDAMVACEALARLPGGAGDAPQRLVTRILSHGETASNAPELEALLKRIHPDGPDRTLPCSGYALAKRWAEWFAERARAPREPDED
ncbi:MAG: hypothetical protein H6825_08485 [Planctomycetes bacterium]|nr:hypothetical protein [Planctomycetota bacterium]